MVFYAKYPKVQDTMYYHEFEQFMKSRGHYIPPGLGNSTQFMGELVPKNQKKASKFRPLKLVMVRGKEVKCPTSILTMYTSL